MVGRIARAQAPPHYPPTAFHFAHTTNILPPAPEAALHTELNRDVTPPSVPVVPPHLSTPHGPARPAHPLSPPRSPRCDKMLSGILIFNQKGENLIFRAFRNDCRPRLADVFRIQVISNAQVRSPILTLGSTTFSHVKHENIYLVAITKSNANAALVFEFLYRLIQLGRGYFGKFDEEAVKNNFVLVYELLDGAFLPPPSLQDMR
jgi:hypothetical protein